MKKSMRNFFLTFCLSLPIFFTVAQALHPSTGTARSWSLLILPTPHKEVNDHHWIKFLEKNASLRLTVALSRHDIQELTPYRDQLLEWIQEDRLEVALRLPNAPSLPLIYDMDLTKIYLDSNIPFPSKKVAWQEDVLGRILRGKMDHKAFWDEWPKGFVPGGGSLSLPIAEFLNDQDFSWTIGGFPESEWSGTESLKIDNILEKDFWIYNAHPLSNLLYRKGPIAYCCRTAEPVVVKILDGLQKSVRSPILVFDEKRTKISLKGFLESYLHLTSSEEAGDRYRNLNMTLCSETYSNHDHFSTSLQVWPYSWNWLVGIGDPKGPGLTTWVGDPQKNAAWNLLNRTRDDIEKYKNSGEAILENLDRAMDEFYLAESGDFFEWFGSLRNQDDPVISQKKSQNRILFQATLANIYRHMGLPIPESLERFSTLSSSKHLPRRKSSKTRVLTNVPDSSQDKRKRDSTAFPSGKESKSVQDNMAWTETNEEMNPSIKKFSFKVTSSPPQGGWIHFLFTLNQETPSPNAVDLYIDINHRTGAGTTDLLPGRNASLSASDGWEFMLLNKRLETGSWSSSLYRSQYSVPLFKNEKVQTRTRRRNKEISFEVKIPQKLLGKNPHQWGYLVCAVETEQGPIIDFLSPFSDKEGLMSKLKEVSEEPLAAGSRQVLLPMIRSESN